MLRLQVPRVCMANGRALGKFGGEFGRSTQRWLITASDALHQLHRATGANLEVQGRSVRLSALGLRRDPHGSVKQIHHEELEDGEKERTHPLRAALRSKARY